MTPQGTDEIGRLDRERRDADTRYNQALTALEKVRDALAGKIKGELEAAAFRNTRVLGASAQAVACQAVIAAANHVEAAS